MGGFNYRILVVDDEAAVRDTAKAILATQGYEIITAVDGFDALVQLRRSLPDLIISDLSMPNMSGFEFLAVVRKRFPHIPIIAVSGAYNGSRGGVSRMPFFLRGSTAPRNCSRSYEKCWKRGQSVLTYRIRITHRFGFRLTSGATS
jgi:response regulator receiver domain-containing protein